jgi:protein TonB
MAEGTARSFDRSGVTSEADRRSRLRLVARNDEAPDRAAALPVSAPEVRSAPVLSASTDLLGIRPAGWIGAGLLYAGLAAAALLLALTATPPEPWPEQQAVFRVVFEPPPAAPAERTPAPEPPQTTAALPPPEPPPPQAEPSPPEPPPAPPPIAAAPPPPEPAPPPLAEAPPAEPTPPPAAEAPPVEPAPPPPPPKPPPRHVLAKPQAPRTAAPAPTPAPPSAPHRSAEAQVAALPPPTLPIEPPRPISAAAGNPKPVYPAAARQRGLQGRVILHVEVSTLGAPLRVNVLTSSGHAILDEAALRAVSAWRFIPATRGGTPIVAAVDVPIQFRLEE